MYNKWDSNRYPATSKYYNTGLPELTGTGLVYDKIEVLGLYCYNISFKEIVAFDEEKNVKLIRIFSPTDLIELEIKKVVSIKQLGKTIYIRSEDDVEIVLQFISKIESQMALTKIQRIVDFKTDFPCE